MFVRQRKMIQDILEELDIISHALTVDTYEARDGIPKIL